MTSGSERVGIKGEFISRAMGVEKVTLTIAADGTASATTNFIQGEILKIAYDKGTIAAAETCVIKTSTVLTGTVQEQIDSYNVNSASAYRYPRAQIASGSAGDNIWTPYVISDTLSLTVTGSDTDPTHSFYVYIYYR